MVKRFLDCHICLQTANSRKRLRLFCKKPVKSESPLVTNLLPFSLEFLVSGLETEKHLVLKCVGTFVRE